MIYPQTASLLESFSKEPIFAKYKAILIGGTAMAYHTQHRVSFDLDICFPFDLVLPKLSFLDDYKSVIPLEFDNHTRDNAINDGGDIDTCIKRYIVDDIKVDFFINPSSNIYENQILKEDKSIIYHNLRIASLDTIFELKILLLLDRNKIRDMYDIVYLLENNGYTIRDFLDTIFKYRITYRVEDIIRLIRAKTKDPLDTDGVEEPQMNLSGYTELRDYILDKLLSNCNI